jgi:hypothetical protein
MVDLIKGTVDALIWAAFLLWPFVLVALIAWLVYRRIRRKPTLPPPPGPGADNNP